MSSDTSIILVFLFIGLFVIYYLLKQRLEQSKTDPTLTAWLKSLQNSIDNTSKSNTLSLQQNYRELFARLDQANTVIADLKKEAGAFGEVSRSMKDLQDYLKSPKLRGNIGEQVLKDLIGQMFPKSSYHLQYRFQNGSIVDVAIKTQAGILPVDSKFPMENFQKLYQVDSATEKTLARSAFIRDVKKHIKDISTKYILPDEDTLDFALMYIPSESIFYEIVNEPELIELARTSRVYPVSPTTLYAHLQTVLLSLEGQKIAGKSTELFALLRTIQNDYEKLSDNFNLLGKHLTNAYNSMNNTTQTLNRIGGKLESARSLKGSISDEKSI